MKLGRPVLWSLFVTGLGASVLIWLASARNDIADARVPGDAIDPPCSVSAAAWARHVVDAQRPWRAVFIGSADIDGDGRRDVIAGGWWYRNPGRNAARWDRHAFGAPANNFAAILDVDGDGRPDILATTGRGDEPDSRLVLAHNRGGGRFTTIGPVAAGAGDFLQGVAAGRFGRDRRLQVALAWNAPDHGIELLTLPEGAVDGRWSLVKISDRSQDEQLSAGDIDRDGDIDLLLGTLWLRNDGGQFTPFELTRGHGSPDRNRLADLDGDGRLDAVVGFEAASLPADVVWYGQPKRATDRWQEHRIARLTGPMSLDVADMDGDGDLDVIVGEHDPGRAERARLLIFENLDGRGRAWREHLVHQGDEHHHGAQVVDIDDDGDLDILSTGWSHDRVLLYENRAAPCAASTNTKSAVIKNEE